MILKYLNCWQMVEEGNKRLRDLCLLEVMLCEATRPKRGLCSLRRPRKHTVYQDHNKCAGVSIISIIKCSVIALFCRPGLVVDTITETSLLIAKGLVGPWCNKSQVVWLNCQKSGRYNYFNELQNQSACQECLTSRELWRKLIEHGIPRGKIGWQSSG